MTGARRHVAAALAVVLVAFPSGAAVAQDEVSTEAITSTIVQIEEVIVGIDAMIANQESRLDELYDRREALDAGAEQTSLDMLIDTLTLQLDEAEVLRGTLTGQADAMRAALDLAEGPDSASIKTGPDTE